MVLEDKTVIRYWYKLPNELIKYQINEILSEDSLLGLERVNFTVGGDHGGGKCRVTFKVLLVFSCKKSISRLYQMVYMWSTPKINRNHKKNNITTYRGWTP